MQKWKETLCIINLKERTQRERERERLTLKMRFLFVASHAKPPLKCMFQTKTRTKAAIASVCATNVNGIAGTLNAISFLFFFPLLFFLIISFLETSQLYTYIYIWKTPFLWFYYLSFFLGIVSSKLSTSLCRAIWTVGLRSWYNLWWMPRWLLSIGGFFD